MRHHQPRQNGISLVTKDVCIGPFLSMFNCKQVSINFPMIQRRNLQDSSVIQQARNVNKDVVKPLMVINHYLHLNVVTFRFEWIIIICNKIFTLQLLQMDQCCINSAMDLQQAKKFFEFGRNFNEITPLMPFDLKFQHYIHNRNKFI